MSRRLGYRIASLFLIDTFRVRQDFRGSYRFGLRWNTRLFLVFILTLISVLDAHAQPPAQGERVREGGAVQAAPLLEVDSVSDLRRSTVGAEAAQPGDEIHLPDLSSDEQKLSYLLAIKKQVPRLFKDSAQYDINLFHLLDEQARLVASLKTDPAYEALYKKKKYHELTVVPPPGGVVVSSTVVKPQAIEDWKKDLQEIAVQWAKVGHEEQSIQEYIESHQGIVDVSDLARTVNQEIFALFKQASSESQKRLIAIFNSGSRANGFQGVLESWDKSLREHFDEIKALMGERVFAQMIKLVGDRLPQLSQANLNLDLAYLQLVLTYKRQLPENAGSVIRALTQDDLIYLSDQNDALKPLVQAAFSSASQRTKELRESLLPQAFKKINRFSSQKESRQQRVTDAIKLQQVIPPVGIFRGCTGGDCSSQFSFPYPNDPHEQVFFIRGVKSSSRSSPVSPEGEVISESGEETDVKGYVSATEVMLHDGSKGLYVITVSGNRVSAGATELIFRGLHAEREKLGVKHILLPAPPRISSLINFPEPRGVYEKYTKGKSLEGIQYQDPSVARAKIEKFSSTYNSGEYDFRLSNRVGVLFDPADTPGKAPSIMTSLEELKGIQKLQMENIDAVPLEDVLEFILDLNHSGRSQMINKVLSISGLQRRISQKEVKSFIEKLKTCKTPEGSPLSVEDWTKGLGEDWEKLVKRKGERLGQKYFEEKPSLFFPGMMNCSDAFEPSAIEGTARLIVDDLRQEGRVSDDYLRNFSSPLIARLNETEAFKSLTAQQVLRLQAERAELRVRAIRTLGAVRVINPDIQLKIVQALTDLDTEVRLAASWALGRIKPSHERVEAALIQKLKDPDFEVRLAVAKVFGQMNTLGEEVQSALLEALNDENASVRARIIDALGEITPTNERIQFALVRALMDKDNGVSQSAGRALVRVSPLGERELSVLIENLKTRDPFLRVSIIELLGQINLESSQIQSILIDRLKDSDSFVQSRAVNSLAERGPMNDEAESALFAAFKDSGVQVRKTIVDTLGHYGPPSQRAQSFLLKAIKDQDQSVRTSVVKALGNIQPLNEKVQSVLLEALRDPRFMVRLSVVEALGKSKILNEGIQLAIVDLLGDSESDVRFAVLGLLGRLPQLNEQIQLALIKYLKNSDLDIYHRIIILFSDQQSISPKVYQRLLEVYPTLKTLPSKVALADLLKKKSNQKTGRLIKEFLMEHGVADGAPVCQRVKELVPSKVSIEEFKVLLDTVFGQINN